MSIDLAPDRPESADELVEVIRYRPIPWDRFDAELRADYYNPKRRAIGTCRGMFRVLDLVGDLTAPGPDGEPVPVVRSTRDLTVKFLTRFLDAYPGPLKWRPYTVQKMLRFIRRICSIAVKSHYLAVNPFSIQPLSSWIRPGRPQGKRHLSRQEIRTILDLLAKDVETRKGWPQWKARRLQALVSIVAYCGLRKSEALNLHVEDIDLVQRLIFVRPRGEDHRLKTIASDSPVPIPPPLVPILESWLAHRLDAPPGFKMPARVVHLITGCRRRGPWTGGVPGTKALDCFQAVARRAGVEHATLHSLRRSLATHLRHFGASAGIASKILRHSTEVDELWYHGTDVDNMRAAVENLEF